MHRRFVAVAGHQPPGFLLAATEDDVLTAGSEQLPAGKDDAGLFLAEDGVAVEAAWPRLRQGVAHINPNRWAFHWEKAVRMQALRVIWRSPMSPWSIPSPMPM